MSAAKRAAVPICLLLAVAGMAAMRWHTYAEPLEMDAATYALIARELRAGRELYSDLFDHKPPAIHATFVAAQALAGSGPAHVYILGLLTATLTLCGVYAAGAAIAGSGAGLVAAAFWAITSADLDLQANQPNTEVFINAALVWAFALLARSPSRRRSLARWLAIGLLCGVATLYKHVVVAVAAMLLAAHVALSWRRGEDWRDAVVEAATAAATVAGMWILTGLYFAASGRFDDFWYAVVTFNQLYAGSPWRNLVDGLVLDRLLAPVLDAALPLALLTGLGFLTPGAGRGRGAALLLAYAIGTALAVALPGRFHPHYYQLWLPVLALGGAWGLTRIGAAQEAPVRWQLRAGAVTAALLLALQLPSLAEPPEEWSRRKFGERLVHNAALGRAVDSLLAEGETFLQWGPAAELYYYSGRRPPSGELRANTLLLHGDGGQRAARMLAALEREPPELLLVSRSMPFPLEHPVPRWLAGSYRQLQRGERGRLRLSSASTDVFVRRGGSLERRLERLAQRAP